MDRDREMERKAEIISTRKTGFVWCLIVDDAGESLYVLAAPSLKDAVITVHQRLCQQAPNGLSLAILAGTILGDTATMTEDGAQARVREIAAKHGWEIDGDRCETWNAGGKSN